MRVDDRACRFGWEEDLCPGFFCGEVRHLIFQCAGVEYGKLDLILWASLVCTAMGIGFTVGAIVGAV